MTAPDLIQAIPVAKCEEKTGFRNSVRCELPFDHIEHPSMPDKHIGRGIFGVYRSWEG